MYQQKTTISFVDGTSKDVVLTQWGMGQFAQWSSRQGLKVDMDDPGLMAVLMLRYQAYAELHRDATTIPSFDKWDRTVAEVEPKAADEVDPTQPTASGG